MTTFRRGVVPVTPSSNASSSAQPTSNTHNVQGRQVVRRAPAGIITQEQPQQRRGVTAWPPPDAPQIVRGMVVDVSGRPIRGLSQATLDAHKAYAEAATELCTRCGEMRPPAAMKTVTPNAERPNNSNRICATECVPVAYKSPYQTEDQWRPSVPAVRFDPETAAPYDARRQGMTISDLINRDTYRTEGDVPSEFRGQIAPTRQGQWSGATHARVGHTPTRRR